MPATLSSAKIYPPDLTETVQTRLLDRLRRVACWADYTATSAELEVGALGDDYRQLRAAVLSLESLIEQMERGVFELGVEAKM